jgi:AAA-like domain
MSRSLRVRPDFIPKVKLKAKQYFPRQKDLAEELLLSLATVSNFLNGRPVDHLNFLEICRMLSFEWREIATFNMGEEFDKTSVDMKSNFSDESDQDSFIYVERPPMEANFLQELQKPGALIRIKAPCLMGKTALAYNVIDYAKKKGYRSGHLNLHLASQEHLSDLDSFLMWFCAGVSQNLGLLNQFKDYWFPELITAKISCTEYFEKYILAQNEAPLVLCLDEVDRLFPHQQVASEFLGLLRTWHEMAKINEVWRRLRLVVVHSTEIYIPLNINESPFNVGFPINLLEFTPVQVGELAGKYKLSLGEADIYQLMDLVGGHPHLVEQTFKALYENQGKTLGDILPLACTAEGIYHNHLRHLWNMIERSPDLVGALVNVLKSDEPILLPGDRDTFQLVSLGVIVYVGNEVKLRCRLYRQYFQAILKPFLED